MAVAVRSPMASVAPSDEAGHAEGSAKSDHPDRIDLRAQDDRRREERKSRSANVPTPAAAQEDPSRGEHESDGNGNEPFTDCARERARSTVGRGADHRNAQDRRRPED